MENNENALSGLATAVADAFKDQEVSTDDTFEYQDDTESTSTEASSDTSSDSTTEAIEDKSSLTESTSEAQTEVKNTTDSTTSKSFEDLLAERTGGKFNKWEDLESVINAPKEDFFDDEVRKINELKKAGVKIDQDWFHLQTRDYENMTDPIELLVESMKLENPSLTDKEIEWEIRSKYRMDEWTQEGQDEDDITPKQKEIEEVFSAKMLREAAEKRDALIAKRDFQSWKAPKNPEAEAKAVAEAQAAQEAWEKTINEVDSKLTKITNNVSDKDVFEYLLDTKEKTDVSTLMKEMGKNAGIYWNQFVEDGKINQQKLYEFTAKARNYDKAVTAAYQKGLATGQEQEVRNIKNVNFKADAPSQEVQNIDPLAKAFMEAYRGKK